MPDKEYYRLFIDEPSLNLCDPKFIRLKYSPPVSLSERERAAYVWYQLTVVDGYEV